MTLDPNESAESEADRQDRFVRLLSKHSSALYGYVLALTANRHDADDVFQETNVVLLRKWEQFEFGTDFLAWSCAIARYKTLSHLSRSRRQHALDPQLIEALSEKALDAARSADQRRDALLECIGKLGASQSRIVQSRYYHQYSVKEIAENLGMSSARVYRSLASIHRSLHECVQRNLGGVGG
ncbi:ECF RNA polymerase sigma factor SigL [Planctomycetes bacterium K2D]|uniref:ECF RNA polymerase sigma factor SigL n=2 Tax=Botrimarina mediterranea TaxID=2528022 RepID=A0A518K2Y9_9BACT|nr:ECF RNA polymerase sigma factor SigL [Botrimarina mediterranea]QDV76657.1 ECF RNA polymerase sigma factor SigL [Planctomycetes bacterium K2D]